jgi:hypothetical protein
MQSNFQDGQVAATRELTDAELHGVSGGDSVLGEVVRTTVAVWQYATGHITTHATDLN